jgi:outer membrane protein assembly factor BamA
MPAGRRGAFVIFLGFAGLAEAQPETPPATRAAEIEAAREEKARRLRPERLSPLEARLLWVKEAKVLERLSAGIHGFRAKLGKMATGQGFGIGPEYVRRDLAGGELTVRAAAQISTRAAMRWESELLLPGLAGERLFAGVAAVRHNYGSINYFGPGPDSAKAGRSNFRYEDVAVDGLIGFRWGRHLQTGVSAGRLAVNVGPGTDRRFVSAERIFTPDQAPGIDRQTDFVRFGVFAQLDYRDSTAGPRSGGNYLVEYNLYEDLGFDRYGFHQLGAELQQYIPFFNKRRVIFLRGKTTLTIPRENQTVPFYLQPVVGGSDDLRGFRPYRFYDNNALVLNAEYRFETFSGLDTALFVDAGKVFSDYRRINFSNLEGSAGFGLRFNVRNAVFLRIDVGFSHEGYNVWIKFGGLEGRRLLGRSSPEYLY